MVKRIIMSLFLIILINFNAVFAQNYEKIKSKDIRIKQPLSNQTKYEKTKILTSRLDRLHRLHAENKEYRQFAKQSKLKLIDDRVIVTILTKPGIIAADINATNLEAFGSIIQAKSKHSMRVEIPIGELENVSSAIKELGEIYPLITPKEDTIISEGIALMNAEQWQTAGYEGSGVKVAVIDGGFMYLTAAQSAGDIPSSYVSHDFSGTGLETETQHGTAVTEAIFDLAPEAEFYLYKIEDFTDFENATDTCIFDSVDIVNHSMSWFNTGGYYDGTGYVCNVTNDAISNGILWINSAGNQARKHYRAIFSNDGTGYHDFGGPLSNINPIGPDSQSVWYHDIGEYIVITMNWDDYMFSDQDYDLYLVQDTGNVTPKWVLVDSSTYQQAGAALPQEMIVFQNTVDSGKYGIQVKRDSATIDVDFTLFSLRRTIGTRTDSSSITDPGSMTDVITVGAISRLNYASGPQEPFSSQGPTNDGRIKPDIAAPDNCNSYAYGYWTGTSLSSPHTAGICALIKSRYPAYSDTNIRNYLYTNCTVDLGSTGKDNIYGWGKIVMPNLGNLNVISPNGGENWQTGSHHNITWTSSETSGTAHIEYSSDNGLSWTDVITSMPDTGAYSWTIPGTPSDSCLIRISDTDGNPSDISDALFTISLVPYITVTSPNGGEVWFGDSTHIIAWISFGTSGNVRIEFLNNDLADWIDVIASTPDTGYYP